MHHFSRFFGIVRADRIGHFGRRNGLEALDRTWTLLLLLLLLLLPLSFHRREQHWRHGAGQIPEHACGVG